MRNIYVHNFILCMYVTSRSISLAVTIVTRFKKRYNPINFKVVSSTFPLSFRKTNFAVTIHYTQTLNTLQIKHLNFVFNSNMIHYMWYLNYDLSNWKVIMLQRYSPYYGIYFVFQAQLKVKRLHVYQFINVLCVFSLFISTQWAPFKSESSTQINRLETQPCSFATSLQCTFIAFSFEANKPEMWHSDSLFLWPKFIFTGHRCEKLVFRPEIKEVQFTFNTSS